eukprot:TRINITY_DN13266_c0_g1_i1.p1 TRINITY_DN13266_c0_g1~~TRINITY_DN13266_c0_g1_i1.p1  ORF type:complete len:1486 (+),score=587.78 TRINITY_DN13266_c0_g1_i1:145-4602(+)
MAERRRSSHLIVKDVFGRYYIVSSLAGRGDAQVITIECATGRLKYTATPGVDLFANAEEALRTIAKGEVVCDAWALLGYLILGNEGLLLVACNAERTCTIPPNHDVLTIRATAWVRIPLSYQFYPPLDDREMAYLNSLLSLEMSESYYYSEGYDVTHLYPNKNAPTEYSREFVWNLEMREEFARVGIDPCCAVVLCGYAAARVFPDYTVTILSRRSCLNSRYLTPGLNVADAPAPGLNPEHTPPNEYEVEFIVHSTSAAKDREGRIVGQRLVWAAHASRTGAVPIESAEGDAPGAVPGFSHNDTAKGAPRYWKQLLRRYGSGVQLLCVSLLNPRAIDSHRYEQSINDVKKVLNVNAEYACCDWRGRMAAGGFGTACEGLWAIASPKFEAHGASSGRQEWGLDGRLIASYTNTQQEGVVRYSCTHGVLSVGGLFAAALQILPELVRLVHPLPYHPALLLHVSTDAPWPLKHRKLSELKLAVPPESLRGIADLVAAHASLVARLYTGLPNDDLTELFSTFDCPPPSEQSVKRNVKAVDVMHRIYQSFPRLAAAYDAGRRVDPPRGVKQAPAEAKRSSDAKLRTVYKTQLLSDQAALPYDVPCAFDVAIPKSLVLLASPRLQFEPWVVPAGKDSVTLTVVLPVFATVTEVHLSIRHTGAETEWLSLARVDILVGRHVDTCLPALRHVVLPLVADNTTLRYVLPAHLTGGGGGGIGPELYPFNNTAAQPLVKVVQVVFHSLTNKAPMLLGGVQVYGRKATLAEPAAQKQEMYDTLFHKIARTGRPDDLPDDESRAHTADPDALPGTPPPAVHDPEPEPELELDDSYDSADDFGAFSTQGSEDGEEADGDESLPGEGLSRHDSLSVRSSEYSATGKAHSASGDSRGRGANPYAHLTLEEALEAYEQEVKAKVRRRVGFTEALEIEAMRVGAGIPSHLRDLVLYKLHQDPNAFDPSRLLYAKDLQVEASMRKRYRDQTPACSNEACQKPFRLKWGKVSCSYCRMTFCSKCMAHEKKQVIEYRWDTPTHDVCLRCEGVLQTQRQRIRLIKRDLQRTNVSAATKASAWLASSCLDRSLSKTHVTYQAASSQAYLIADLNTATILKAVPTDPRSPPVESVLFHPNAEIAARGRTWFAPAGRSEVTIDLCLGVVADVTSVVVVGDRWGYGGDDADALSVDIAIGAVVSDLTRVSSGVALERLAPGGLLEVLRTGGVTLRQRQGTRVVRLTFTRRGVHPSRGPYDVADSGTEGGASTAVDDFEHVMRQRIHLGQVLVYGCPRAVGHGDTVSKAFTSAARKDPSLIESSSHTKLSYLQHTPPSTLAYFLNTHHSTINTTELKVDSEEPAAPAGRGGGWVLDVRLKDVEMSRTVMGFHIHHTHDDPSSHAKDIRVTCFRFFSSDAQSQIHVGDFLLPSAPPGTHLQYLFPSECQLSTVRKVRFEVLSHYGAAVPSKPTVSLFASNTGLQISRTPPVADDNPCRNYVAHTAAEFTEADV